MNIGIIFAGGCGERLNGSEKNSLPKQFIEIDGIPILIHTLKHFQNHEQIDKIYLAMIPEYIDFSNKLIEKYNITKVAKVLSGGKTAQDSIYNALKYASKENPADSIVLIHDGVRPIITPDVISNNIKSVIDYGTGITSTPCYETILISENGVSPQNVPLRKDTYAAQAPQSFRLNEILDAHEKIRETENGYKDIVDACTLFTVLGKRTHLVRGNFGNIKITTPQDVYILKGILNFLECDKLIRK